MSLAPSALIFSIATESGAPGLPLEAVGLRVERDLCGAAYIAGASLRKIFGSE